MPSIAQYVSVLIDELPGVQAFGMKVSEGLHDWIRKNKPVREAVDVLHGKQAGHPVHPIIIYVPMGGWLLGTAFDVVAALSGSRKTRRRARGMARSLVQIGTAAAVPSMLTGLADYSGLEEKAVKTGTLHAIFNIIGFASYGVSLITRERKMRDATLALSLAGLASIIASGYLGGDMVYKHRVGVNHNEPVIEAGEWETVLPLHELIEQQPKRIEVKDQAVLLYRQQGEVYAIGAVCSHAGGPLQDGKFEDGCVECPWHHSVFRLEDGSVRHGPAVFPQPSYDVRINQGQIEVRLRQESLKSPEQWPESFTSEAT